MLDDIKKTLWATADKLRANMDAAEYKHLVLGLIFVKYNDADFEGKMQSLTEKLGEQMAKGAELDELIRRKLGGLGYEF